MELPLAEMDYIVGGGAQGLGFGHGESELLIRHPSVDSE